MTSPTTQIVVRYGDGDHPVRPYIVWTLEQATTLLQERRRGSSVEEIAHATGHTIPATYAKLKELERTCRRGA